jgi:hypothetical protein
MMSHNYLLEIFTYIEQRLTRTRQELAHSEAKRHDAQYISGQIEVLCDFERFLFDNFNIKLPRRLRK